MSKCRVARRLHISEQGSLVCLDPSQVGPGRKQGRCCSSRELLCYEREDFAILCLLSPQ